MAALTYKDAGVDIDEAERFVDAIRPVAATTRRPEVLGGIGGFGGLFALPPGRFREPVLVSGTDGVGTKLKLAFATGKHDTIGIDLVAMCVNDIIVVGAEPLFFLDYYGTSKLETEVAVQVVEGIAEGCRQAGCALLGGETAELPGFYAAGEYDLAGFCVGVVERSELIDGSKVAAGDAVIGLHSSGLHSNGFSLARRSIELLGHELEETPAPLEETLAQTMLTPTRIYARAVVALRVVGTVHALAHITGGGLPGNVPRSLPEGLGVELDASRWPRPPIYEILAGAGIEPDELYRTFNMGIGMTVVVPADAADATVTALKIADQPASIIGTVVDTPGVRIEER